MTKKLLYTSLILVCILTLAVLITQHAVQGQEPTAVADRIPLSIDNLDQIVLLGASLVEANRSVGGLPNFTPNGDRLLNVPTAAALLYMTTVQTWRFSD